MRSLPDIAPWDHCQTSRHEITAIHRAKRSLLDIAPWSTDEPHHRASIRLLGVKLSQDLKWPSHVSEITKKKALRHLYFILIIILNRTDVDFYHFVNVYSNSFDRWWSSHACQVWHTSVMKHQTKQLDSTQRRGKQYTKCVVCRSVFLWKYVNST